MRHLGIQKSGRRCMWEQHSNIIHVNPCSSQLQTFVCHTRCKHQQMRSCEVERQCRSRQQCWRIYTSQRWVQAHSQKGKPDVRLWCIYFTAKPWTLSFSVETAPTMGWHERSSDGTVVNVQGNAVDEGNIQLKHRTMETSSKISRTDPDHGTRMWNEVWTFAGGSLACVPLHPNNVSVMSLVELPWVKEASFIFGESSWMQLSATLAPD